MRKTWERQSTPPLLLCLHHRGDHSCPLPCVCQCLRWGAAGGEWGHDAWAAMNRGHPPLMTPWMKQVGEVGALRRCRRQDSHDLCNGTQWESRPSHQAALLPPPPPPPPHRARRFQSPRRRRPLACVRVSQIRVGVDRRRRQRRRHHPGEGGATLRKTRRGGRVRGVVHSSAGGAGGGGARLPGEKKSRRRSKQTSARCTNPCGATRVRAAREGVAVRRRETTTTMTRTYSRCTKLSG